MSFSRTANACFSGADALPIVAPDLTAVLKTDRALPVFTSCACSAPSVRGLGLARYTTAISRSASIWASTWPVGKPMVSFTVLDRARLMASLAVMLTTNAYSPIRDRIGIRTSRKILRRMDRRCKPMTLPSARRCNERTPMSGRSPGKVCEPNTAIPRSLAKGGMSGSSRSNQQIALFNLSIVTPRRPLAGLPGARQCHRLLKHPKGPIWGRVEGGQVRTGPCALARHSRVLTLLTGRCSSCAASLARNCRFLALRSSSGCGWRAGLAGWSCWDRGLGRAGPAGRDASVAGPGCRRGRVGSCRGGLAAGRPRYLQPPPGYLQPPPGFAFGVGQPAAARYDVCVSYGRRAARTGFGLGVPGRTTQVRPRAQIGATDERRRRSPAAEGDISVI